MKEKSRDYIHQKLHRAVMTLSDEISVFLCEHGIRHETVDIEDRHVVIAHTGSKSVHIIPVEISSEDIGNAELESLKTGRCIDHIQSATGQRPMIITEDRWRSQGQMTGSRLLAHLEIFTQVYARNCEIRKIDKQTAAEFLNRNHSYGDAACRYRYGLYLKRHTGHNAESRKHINELIAVATFSNARKWVKSDKTIRSYEWTRYASLPDLRISGGMGRLMKAFIADVGPDDIMSYADLEWSEGNVYEALGFSLEGRKSPVAFSIDIHSWDRSPSIIQSCSTRYFINFGSNKYRLKLTDYQ